jgi:hypothetical protein
MLLFQLMNTEIWLWRTVAFLVTEKLFMYSSTEFVSDLIIPVFNGIPRDHDLFLLWESFYLIQVEILPPPGCKELIT